MTNETSHPIIDQPNSITPQRTRILSNFSRSFTAAKYTGVKNTQTKTDIAIAYFITANKFIPINIYLPYVASLPNSSSMRINWLYFAILSVRDIEPVLI